MSEADEIADSLFRANGIPQARTYDEASAWLDKIWPTSREWFGDQMRANVVEATLSKALTAWRPPSMRCRSAATFPR
jgi:hypothetical protein